MKHILLFTILFSAGKLTSQIWENFQDHDLTLNPTWTGDLSNFITNASDQLQSNQTVAGTSYLALPHNLDFVGISEWHFYLKLAFAPSGSNYAKFYLTANSSDLSTNPDGYFLQFGEAGSTDAIRLVGRNLGVNTEICAGPLGAIATGVDVKIKVLRDQTGYWELFIDPAGGENYSMLTSGTDNLNLLGNWSGIQTVYTASNGSKFYLDHLYLGPKIVDLTPPALMQLEVTSPTSLVLTFDEPLSTIDAENITHYQLLPTIGIVSCIQQLSFPEKVNITLIDSLQNDTNYTLHLQNIADINSNILLSFDTTFHVLYGVSAEKSDIIIQEIFADPSPSVGLKNVEYIELYNRSQKYISIHNWRLSDGTSTAIFPDSIIKPNQYLIVCPLNGIDSFAFHPYALANFPSLNNTGDHLMLSNSSNMIIDEVSYSDTWYQDAFKKDGGYSLERIHPNHPCSDAKNWIASNDPTGGTPGLINSVFDNTLDTIGPKVQAINVLNNSEIQILFTEPIDSNYLTLNQIVHLPNLSLQSLSIPHSFADEVNLQLLNPLDSGKYYHIKLLQIQDCWSNTSDDSMDYLLPFELRKGDIYINEILFNPVTNGSDWIELYNASDRILHLDGLNFANWKDSVSNLKSVPPVLFHPKTYLVFGNDSSFVKNQYPYAQTGCYVEMVLPSYNNDSSSVFLVKDQQIIDRVSYQEDWHFKLLESTDGVSLERISWNLPSNDQNNWHSAAENIGFGTPGFENSQFLAGSFEGELSLENKVISPDNDGYEDVLFINYRFEAIGMVANLRIFDEQGRLKAILLNNELMAKKGTITWDGVTDEGVKATIGPYILVFEAFQVDSGKTFHQKLAFTVAGK